MDLRRNLVLSENVDAEKTGKDALFGRWGSIPTVWRSRVIYGLHILTSLTLVAGIGLAAIAMALR
jgi:hypothetical protein